MDTYGTILDRSSSYHELLDELVSFTAVYSIAIELYNEFVRKTIYNTRLQPPVAEKKPHFGGMLSAKTVC